MMKRRFFYVLMAGFLLCLWASPALAQAGSTHVVQAGETLAGIAAQYGVSEVALMNANGLTNPDWIVAGDTLVVPQAGAGASTQAPVPAGEIPRTYTVQAGDTLSSIAARFNTTAPEIAVANGMNSAEFILLGQVLTIPGGTADPATLSSASSTSSQATTAPAPNNFNVSTAGVYNCGATYTVQPGNTLSEVAWRYGTTVQAIMRTNNLTTDIIYVGQRLCVPGGAVTPPPPAINPDGRHTVRPGETLAAIAMRYGVTQAALAQANNIYNQNLIYVGQVLIIPGYAKPPAPEKPVAQKPPAEEKDEVSATPVPDYVPARDYPEAQPHGCFYPRETLGDPPPPVSTDPPEYEADPQREVPITLVEAVGRWCADVHYGDDPDGLTAVAIRTIGQPGTTVKVRVGNEVVTVVTGALYDPNPETYVYKALSPGTYEVYVEGGQSEKRVITVEAGQRAYVDFRYTSVSEEPRPRSATGWTARVLRNDGGAMPAGSGVWSLIIVRAGASGLPISIRADGGFHAECYTGSKPELGGGACEFSGLWPGKYTLTLEGAGIAAEVFVDGAAVAEVVFER